MLMRWEFTMPKSFALIPHPNAPTLVIFFRSILLLIYTNYNYSTYLCIPVYLLQIPNRKTNTFGANYLVSRGDYLWNTLPYAIKKATSTAIFKERSNNGMGAKATEKYEIKQKEVIVRILTINTILFFLIFLPS